MRALLAIAALLRGAHGGSNHYRVYGGYIPAGGDLRVLPAGTSAAAAMAACDALGAACAGLTFDGPRAGPAPGSTYRKNATASADFVPDAASNWTSYLRVSAPCDVLAAAGTPCVAAHSTVRALYASYAGPLYRVARADGGELDVLPLAGGAGGVADAAAVDAFCPAAAGGCNVSVIYDQSSSGNDLTVAPQERAGSDLPVAATAAPITLGGVRAYGALFGPGQGYRCVNTSGMATGNEEEVIYAVVDGERFNDGCCFDYGNAGVLPGDYGDGSMEALYFGNAAGWSHGFGGGPWVGADLENGIWYGNVSGANPGNMPLKYPFILAQLKGGANGFALKASDATQGKLQTMYDGPRPGGSPGPYQPMQKRGGLILGIGGDNTRIAIGTFYEGAVARGYTRDADDDALQRSVVDAGYGA